MVIVFLMNEEIACGMVCFFHQKKHSYLIKTMKCWIETVFKKSGQMFDWYSEQLY
jgi:hypothetical protein